MAYNIDIDEKRSEKTLSRKSKSKFEFKFKFSESKGCLSRKEMVSLREGWDGYRLVASVSEWLLSTVSKVA